VVGHYKTAR